MEREQPENRKCYQPIFVARQPIFDRTESIWGYELLFRHSDHVKAARITNDDVATASIIADGFTMAMEGLEHTKKIFINFPQKLLVQGSSLALPSDKCIIEILETVNPDQDVLAACRKVKEQGFVLALDDYVGQPGFEAFLELADIVKVDILGRTPAEIIKLFQRLNRYKCFFLAEKVEDEHFYHLTRSLGFNLFQGFYFSKPEMLKGRKISAGEVAKINVLQELAQDEYKIDHLARIISTDISLSYRLLKYLNSAYFALPQKIRSISQAITLLGQNPLRQWLMVVILAELQREPLAEELVFASIRRGRFLELIAHFLRPVPYSHDAMFMLGLFSNLDAMLGQDMREIMGKMPLEDEIKNALCGESNKARNLLDLAAAFEHGEWDEIDRLLVDFRLAPDRVALANNQAQIWAHNILLNTRED